MLTLLAATLLAGCDIPVVTASIVMPGTTMSPYYPTLVPDMNWTVSCPPTGSFDCHAGIGIISTSFAADNSGVDGRLIGQEFLGQLNASGTAPLPIRDSCFGCKVVVDASGTCGHGLAASGSTSAPSAAVVIPPFLVVPQSTTVLLDYDGYPAVVDVDQIPVNTPFRVIGQFMTRPRGAERATVRLVGSGVDLTKTYGDDVATDSAIDTDVLDAYRNDPTTMVSATTTGTVRMWLEFEGLKSNEVTLTIIPRDTTGTGGGGGSSSGSGGGGGSSGSPAPGCTAAPSDLLFGALALLLARGKRGSRVVEPTNSKNVCEPAQGKP